MTEQTASEEFATNALEHLQRLPRALYPGASGRALPTAVFKSVASDFQVDELLPFTADGEGHHLLLNISKERLNTAEVQLALSVLAGCRQSDVGYSGLKDFHAVTTQWFTVPLTTGCETIERVLRDFKEGNKVECRNWLSQMLQAHLSSRAGAVEIISMVRHQRKLRRGTHRRNRFRTILRGCSGKENFEKRLKFIQLSGFPNYTGLQRFGRGASNLKAFHYRWDNADIPTLTAKSHSSGKRAKARLRHTEQMAVSAMRSLVFNLYCRSRVSMDSWLIAGPAEPLLLGEGNSFFLHDDSDETVAERIEKGKLNTSGPLFGKTDAVEEVLASRLEKERNDILYSLAGDSPLSLSLGRLLGPPGSGNSGDIFSALGLRHSRRALRRFAYNLTWRWLDETSLELHFELSTGTYATALFHQLGELSDGSALRSGG